MEYFFVVFLASLFTGILLLSFFFGWLASRYQHSMQQKRLRNIESNSQYRTMPKHVRPGDDFLSKDRGIEKLKEERKEAYGVELYNATGTEIEEQPQIVDVAKPIGIWTNLIMKQKLGFIIAMGGMKDGSANKFWQNMIKAQEAASRGHNQSRGRN